MQIVGLSEITGIVTGTGPPVSTPRHASKHSMWLGERDAYPTKVVAQAAGRLQLGPQLRVPLRSWAPIGNLAKQLAHRHGVVAVQPVAC